MKTMVRQWTLRLLASTALIGFAATAGILGFWVSDRTIPTETIRARLLTAEVPQGGDLQTQRVVMRSKLCHTTIDRYMIDSAGRRFDLGLAVYPNGTGIIGQEAFIGAQNVPEAMAPGPAIFTALACYRCNPVHWIWPLCEPPRSRKFIVIEKPE